MKDGLGCKTHPNGTILEIKEVYVKDGVCFFIHQADINKVD
jgi:hypothetical protein